MTDRIPLDHLTSDALDDLYDRLEHAEAELRAWTEGESADAAAGSYAGRAEAAEAALKRVRELARRTQAATEAGADDWQIGQYELATAVLDILTEPATPLPAPPADTEATQFATTVHTWQTTARRMRDAVGPVLPIRNTSAGEGRQP